MSVALANVIAPFQISVPKSVQRAAFEELTIEVGFGRQLGLILVDSEREIRRSLQRLSTFSDRSAAVVKDAKKKPASVENAVEYLAKHGLGPAPLQIEDADAEEG